jgi:integrase
VTVPTLAEWLEEWSAAPRHHLEVSAGDPLADVWATALGTGMRRGELVGLRCGDVDLGGARLTVTSSLVHVDGKTAWKPPKTGRTRTISLDPRTLEVLDRRSVSRPAHAPVFTDTVGGPILPNG